MKKALIIAMGAIGVLGGVALMFRNKEAVATSAARPWPGGMGSLETAAAQWPKQPANDASRRLKSLADALPKDAAVEKFVEREITRGDLSIGDPPALPDLSTIRELLLREPMVWERYDEVGHQNAIAMRASQMRLARVLVASALTKARAKAPAAWDDLQAVWMLARSLKGHPQMMTQTSALAMLRLINAVAWKMPLPVPIWFGELQSHDPVRRMLEAFQFQTALYWKSSWIFPTKWFANSIENDRLIAEELVNLTRCDVNMRMNEVGTDLSSVWRRAFRYRAEREATANALRIREQKAIDTSSQCSDGGWTFDGTTLRFSREIATAPPDSPMSLVLRVKP